MQKQRTRDIEKACTSAEFAARLRRVADALEKGSPFRLQIAGERVCVPAHARCTIEHEREGSSREIEFQLKWTTP